MVSLMRRDCWRTGSLLVLNCEKHADVRPAVVDIALQVLLRRMKMR